jgi:hypothetical protein
MRKLLFYSACIGIILFSCTRSDYFAGNWKGDVAISSISGTHPVDLQFDKNVNNGTKQENYVNVMMHSEIYNTSVYGIHVVDGPGGFAISYNAVPAEGQIHNLFGNLANGRIEFDFFLTLSGAEQHGTVSNATKH